MDNHTNSAHEETREWVYEDGNEAIETVISMLSPAAAAETTRFMVDTSLELCPEAVRGHPDTPAARTLRKYHFVILMTQIATAYADGRGQDFADGRSALDRLLQEEPEHQPLAVHFREIMGLWLQDAHDKRQQEEFESDQRRQRKEGEREMKEVREREEVENNETNENIANIENNEQSNAKEDTKASKDSPSSSAADQHEPEDSSEVEGPLTPDRAKSVFDLSGLIDSDEDGSTSDGDNTSSDED